MMHYPNNNCWATVYWCDDFEYIFIHILIYSNLLNLMNLITYHTIRNMQSVKPKVCNIDTQGIDWWNTYCIYTILPFNDDIIQVKTKRHGSKWRTLKVRGSCYWTTCRIYCMWIGWSRSRYWSRRNPSLGYRYYWR